MNVNMWNHPATQENLECLRVRGVRVVDPDEGYLACGMTGSGRLAGQDAIIAAVHEALTHRRDLQGHTVLITAGPTQEALDPVRFLTNRSSGRMGYAVAEAAAQRGANVILISGPAALETPAGVTRFDVRTGVEMSQAVENIFPKRISRFLLRPSPITAPAKPLRKKSKRPAAKSRFASSPIPISWPPLPAKKAIA